MLKRMTTWWRRWRYPARFRAMQRVFNDWRRVGASRIEAGPRARAWAADRWGTGWDEW